MLPGGSALVRTLESRTGILLQARDGGDAFGRALLEELDAEAVLLGRHQGRLLAVASLGRLETTRPLLEEEVRKRMRRFTIQVATLEGPRPSGGRSKPGDASPKIVRPG